MDWINTIKEPHCLLASSLSNLKDGMVFIEFLRQYLVCQGMQKEEINISNDLSPEERLTLLLTSIMELTNGRTKEKANDFYILRNKIYQDDRFLIQFLLFLKELYETLDLGKAQTVYTNTNFNNTEDKFNTIENEDNKKAEGSVVFHSDFEQPAQITENPEEGVYKIENNETENQIETNENIIYNNNDFKNVKSISLDILSNERKPPKKSFASKYKPNEKLTMDSFNNHNPLSPKIIPSNYRYTLSPSNSEQFSISPKNNSNTISVPHNYISSPMNHFSINQPKETKKVKAQVLLTTGIYSTSYTKNPKLDKFFFTGKSATPIPLIKFYHPTNPIIDIDLSSLRKMYPYFPKNSQKVLKKTISQKFKPLPKSIPGRKNEQSIKKWLISLNLLDNSCYSVPIERLFANGVLFCDILNRCEGRNKVIKSVIKNPFTKTQIKMNVNKACEYMRSMKNLYPFIKGLGFFEDEILRENGNVIYSVADSLYRYYNSLNKKKYSGKIAKIPKLDILSARNGNNSKSSNWMNIHMNYEIKSTSSRKAQNKTINTYGTKIQNQKKLLNNNMFDNSTFMLNGSSSFNSDNNFNQGPNPGSPQPLTQISSISGIPKQKQMTPDSSNSSIYISPSNNNSSIANWREIGNGLKFKNKKPKKEDSKSKFNCFLLFKGSNLDKMKKEMKNKERKLFRSQGE